MQILQPFQRSEKSSLCFIENASRTQRDICFVRKLHADEVRIFSSRVTVFCNASYQKISPLFPSHSTSEHLAKEVATVVSKVGDFIRLWRMSRGGYITSALLLVFTPTRSYIFPRYVSRTTSRLIASNWNQMRDFFFHWYTVQFNVSFDANNVVNLRLRRNITLDSIMEELNGKIKI